MKLYITDCDHVDCHEEESIFKKNNIEYEILNCHTEDELIYYLQNAEAVGNQYAPFTEKVFSKLPRLKLIVRYGVGIDHIDLEAASRHNVYVCNIPDYGTQEVAIHAVLLMLALTRKLIPMNKAVHKGKWSYEDSIPIERYSGMTIGVLGLGRIGSCFIEFVRSFGCRLIANDLKTFLPKKDWPNGVEMVSFEQLLEQSDVISIHSPLETSHNLFNEKALKKMKPSAFLINVSRGGIVDEKALDKALSQKWIAGAATDVFVKEPVDAEHPLLKHENFIATPHMAWYSEQSAVDLNRKLAEELVRYVKGEPLRYMLNR